MTQRLPLEGLKVVDFSRLLPGPYASLVLADLGAEVWKVEDVRGGDYLRWMPPLTGKTSYAFNALNGGKRSVALDLKKPEGVEVAKRLLADADVLIESFRPGVMDRLGLGYEALRQANPRLVYCAISGYGQDGPLRERAGHDLNYQAMAGVLGLAGPRDGAPAVPPIQLGDIAGGALWGLTGVLAALFARQTTGEGACVDVSMTDGAMAFLHMALAPHLGAGAAPPARGGDTLTGGQACYGIYETADGRFLSVAPLEPKFWQAFCQAIGRPDLQARQFGSAEQIEATRAEVAAVLKGRTRAEWEAVFAQTDACCEPVLEPDELASHPLHTARGNVIEDAAGTRRLRTPLRPVDAPAPTPAPALGADTRALLAALGYDEGTIADLALRGVIGG